MSRSSGFILLALFLGGCSGGGGDDRLSQSEFKERANSICAKYQQQLDALEPPEDEEGVPPYVDEALPIVRSEVTELRALRPSAEAEEEFGRLLDDLDTAIAALEDLDTAATAGDDDAADDAFQQLIDAGNRADSRAQSLDLQECVEREG